MPPKFTIVGVGEALLDIRPEVQRLGGAPLNVAIHAHQLAQPLGGRGVIVSRIGQDDPARQLVEQLAELGMTDAYLQRDPDRPTGEVYVDIDLDGNVTYEIAQHAAWDWLQFDPDLEGLASRCDAVCFGTLAQRGSETRMAVNRFVNAARRALRMFDVNLRGEAYDQRLLRSGCEIANILKLNIKELPIVASHLGVQHEPGGEDETIAGIMRRWEFQVAALTRGPEGTVLYHGGKRYEGEKVAVEATEPADAVGAGDACAAALLLGLVRRWPMQRTVNLANHVGAHVASQPGAITQLPDHILEMVKG